MKKYILEECCEILDSKRIPITEKDRIAGIYPYYGANGIQDYVNEYIFDDELVLLAENGGNFGSKEFNQIGIYRTTRRKNMECIEWLFFDVGSTLMNEEKAYLHRLHDVADAVNKTFEEIYDMAITLYKENKKGDLEIMRLYGLPKLKWYKEDEDLYADTFEVLDELSKKYKIGVIANQSLGTAERLEQKGILKFIDLVIASAEEGISKPDKRIFEIALSRAKCNAENAIMIGDRIDNDIVPAKQMGMKTIWIKQGFGKYWNVAREEEKADYEIDNLISILSLLG